MCQLLGVNGNRPSQIYFLWTGFQQRGGRTDTHGDGWGLSFFEGKSVRLFMDEQACCESSLAQWVKSCPFKSTNIIGHIRKATEGKVGMSNTHPFVRELWGRNWVFTHNGTLKNYFPEHKRFYPVGETDSERAFCWMMDRLAERFPDVTSRTLPSWETLWAALLDITTEIAQFGTFNYMLSYGDFLLVRCATHLHYTLRKSPFSTVRMLDENIEVDLSTLNHEETKMAVVATQPLTNETWTRLQPGEIVAFHAGEIIYRAHGDPGNTPGASVCVGQ
jgi:predicted glutamine amidotransferase